MDLLIDNTGLHSAGRCLRREGKANTDVEGLLQLGSQLIFSDRVFVSTFETPGVRARSEETRDRLYEFGFEKGPLSFWDVDLDTFKQCCLSAADRLAKDLEFSLDEKEVLPDQLEIAVPDLRTSDNATFDEVHSALTFGLTDSLRQELANTAFSERENPTQIFMVTASEALWKTALEFANTRRWEMPDTYRLIVHLRYYLNQELAHVQRAQYSPAVSRGRLVKQRSAFLLSRIEAIVSEAASDLCGHPSEHPSVVDALLLRSRGEHRGLIEEIQHAREKAAPLRAFLKQRESIRSGSNLDASDIRELSETMAALRSKLRKDLGLEPRPRIREAFEIQFLGLVPLPTIQTFVKLYDSLSFRRDRKIVSVLSEFCHAISLKDLDPHARDRMIRFSLDKGRL